MANPNPFLQSPVDALTSLQNEPASGGLPDMSNAPQPTSERRPPKPDNLIPPQNLLPVFEQAAQKYDVPINVLMALGHQESRFNSRAIGPTTQWGRAKGMMQYLDSTAEGMGINPFDPNQSIDAAAKQIRDRLAKGYSMEDAVKEHFAGPDRKLWGKKTDIYGREVMEKAGLIGSAIVGGSPSERGNVGSPASAGLPNMDDERANTQRLLDEEEQGRYRVMTPQQLEEFKLAKEKEEIDGEKAANAKPWTERMAEGAVGGYDNTMQALSTARYVMSGGGDAQALAADMSKKIIADSKKQKTTGEKEIDAAFQRVTDAEGAWNTTKEGLKAIGTSIMNPKDLSVAAAEQAANMLPSIVGGVAGAGGGAAVGAGVGATALGAGAVPGAAVGAVWGGRAGMVAGTVITEMGNETEFMVMKRLKEAKLPPTPENIQQILEDKKFITEAQKQGSIKGLTIGVIDQLTLKLGGKLATAPAKSAVTKTAKVGGALLLDSTGEVIGEGTSQKLARGEVDYGDSLREGVLSLPTSVAHTAVGAGIEKTNQAFRDPNARAARDLYNEVNGSDFSREVVNQEVVASLDPKNAQMVMTDKAGNVTVRYPAPSSAPGPLSRSVENAAQPVQDSRVTVNTPNGKITGFAEQYDQGADGTFTARILGDDGQTYTFTEADGVQIEQASGPLTSAIDSAAEDVADDDAVEEYSNDTSLNDFKKVYESPENAEYDAANKERRDAYDAYDQDRTNKDKLANLERARARSDAATASFEKLYKSVYGKSPFSGDASADAKPAVTSGDATWRNADTDIPVKVVGIEPQPGSDGRTYARVNMGGKESFVPADELVQSAQTSAATPTTPPTPASMDETQLRDRMKYLANQAKMNGGWNKALTGERRAVEAEINRRKKATPTEIKKDEAAPVSSNGFIQGENGYKVRVSQHKAGSNLLDPKADVGAFVYEVRKGDNDANPLVMVINKDGKLVTAKDVLSGNESNGTAWVPTNQTAADAVRGLLEERAKTVVGSYERKDIDAKIAAIVKQDQGKSDTSGGAPKADKPKTISKEDADHLFGVDKKRAAAMDRIAKGTAYFGTPDKAKDFITKNGLKDTHEVVQTGKVRFEVKLKASQAAPIEPAQNAPQSEWDAYDAAMTAIPDAEQPSTAKSIEQQKDERRLEQESLEASIPDSVRRGIDQRGWERWAKASGKYVDGAFNSPSQKADAVALIAFEKSATKEQKKRVLQLINVSEEKARKANGNDQRTDDKPNGAKEVRGKNAKGSKAGSTKADQSNQAQEVTGETNGAQTPEAKQAEAQGSEASAAPAAVVKKAKQAPMPTESFDSTAGVGKILAVKERYGDKYGVSWASTNIASADTMEDAAAIAKAVAESGADNIADMRAVAKDAVKPAGKKLSKKQQSLQAADDWWTGANKPERVALLTQKFTPPIVSANSALEWNEMGDGMRERIAEMLDAKKPDTSLLPKSESAKVNDFLEGRTDTAPTVEEVQAEQQKAPEEKNLAAAKALIAEQKAATGNSKAEAAVRKKARDLASNTPITDDKTVLALDMIATRLGMGDDGKKALDFAPAAEKPEAAPDLTKLYARIAEVEKSLETVRENQRKAEANGNAWTYDKKIADLEQTLAAYQKARENLVNPPAENIFAKNKIFTADKVEAARARMKSKFGQLNSGIDPEMMIDGMTVAGAYIESGVRSFAAYAKAMIEDFGDGVKPYLLSFYEGARNYPGLDNAGMSSVDEAKSQHAALITPADVKTEAVGEVVSKPATRTKKTGAKGDMTMTQDFGVEHVDGYGDATDNSREDALSDVKAAFIKDAKAYLTNVANVLETKGYTAYTDKRGRSIKPVSVNEAGIAVSGDVSLTMQGTEGGGVYVTISGSSLRGVVPTTQSGISVMFRVADENDKYGTKGRNQWMPVNLSAAELADLMDKSVKAEVARSAKADTINTQEKPNDTKPSSQDAGSGAQGQAALGLFQDEGKRDSEGVSGASGVPDTGAGDRGASGARKRQTVSGDTGSDAQGAGSKQSDQGSRGRSAPASNRADKQSRNYRIKEGELKREGSWRQTAERNVEIVELIKRIDAEGRTATDAERALMTKFTGWGASEIANGIFPDRYGRFKDAYWQGLGERLKAAMTPTEYDQAKRTTQYAHYTSEGVIRSIYSGLERLGFKGGAIVEPGMGTGLFNGLMPDGMAANSQYTGIEYDTLTGKIAQQLYPDSNIIIGDFTRTNLPKDFFDAAIGNPPFSQTQVTNDPEYKAQRPMLHDYFFMKTIDRVKPGGILVFVTSKGTMDKTSDKSRKYLAARGNLLGAIRLPQTAFKDNAGTEVVTDVIFIQKRGEGIPENGVNWLNTKEVQTPQGATAINEYFADHPEMVLGSHALTGSMYRANEYTVIPQEGVDIEQAFAKAVENLPKSIARVVQGSKAERAIVQDRDFNPKSRKEGGLYLDDKGRLMQVDSGTGVELAFRQGADGKQIALTPKQKKWLRDYVGVRDALKQTQFDQLNDGDWEKSLKALNKAYDAFVKDHGRILDYTTIETTDKDGNVNETKRFKNASLIYTDVEGALAYALEEIKEDGSIEKGVVLKQRVLDKPKDPEIKTTNDALFVSLNKNGELDIEDVARLAGTDPKSVISDLGTSIYESPDKGWQLADEYLSGNVVRKLREAQAAAEINPKYKRNVDALLAVQPQPLGPTDITVRIGANWVPPSDISQFASEVIGDSMDVSYNPVLGAWSVEARSRNVSEWGFARMQSSDILESVLNSRQIKVTYRDAEGKTHTDVESTEKANDIAAKMREQFRSWVWKDPIRAERLVKYYNENFNNIAPRKFDGSHLTLPGVSSRFKLYPHQKRAVWRVIQQGDTYLAHAVGAGKTMEMIAAGMEERRLGLSKKPMYVVPNHMLAQFSREFLELYPAANIMVADEQNFHSNNRKRFVAQAALNNPDAIVITHSAFGRISMSDDFSDKFINDQIDKWKETLADIPKEDRVTTKQIERRIEALERRLEGKQGKEKKDKVLDFEELGVDRLFVDEFHEFRKLDFPTNQGNIKGIDPNGSQRALDLYMKVSYLRGKNPGRSLVAASGTPVTNTMGELYTAQRFFQPGQLEEDGTDTFDAWSAQYGDVVTGFEQNAAGGYEMVNRFAKFQNVPELMRRVRSFMDILTSNNLGELVKRPDVIGGGREIKVTPVPDGYKEYQQQLQNRISAIRNRKGPPKKGDDIILSVISDGRFSAIDMRFVDTTRPSDPTSKLNVWVDDIIKAYKDTADYEYADKTTGKPDALKGASVIGFSDIGLGEASAANRGFDMRAWIEKRFADAGIPADHVAFMRDYKQHAKKERLFADMREGKKRILIGGKEMETGTNVQKRLANLFHLDAPWFPASVEQREGRIIRQGNQNKEVKINAYATKGSYDSTMWGMNARKARFIEQAMNGDDSVRSLDDVSEASAFEMASALASGDERYLKLAGLKTDVERLERLRHAHYQDQNTLRREKHNAEDLVKNSEKRVKEFETAIAKRKPIKAGEFEGKVEGKTYDNREEFSQALFTAAKALGTAMFDGEKKLAEVGGFDVIYYGIEQKGSGNYAGSLHVDLPGSPDPLMVYPVDPGAPVNGIATRAANQINGMDREVEQAKQRIEQGKARSEQIGKRLGAAFPEEAILMEKVAELSALESELAAEGAAANAEAAAAAAEAEGKQEAEPEAEPKYSVAATRDPKELEAIFDNLEKRGLARKRANDSISSDPDAAIIQYVDNNFFDILGDLDDSGKVKIKC